MTPIDLIALLFAGIWVIALAYFFTNGFSREQVPYDDQE